MENDEVTEERQIIRKEEEIRGGIAEVAYKIGSILENKTKSRITYFKVRSVEQFKNYLCSTPHYDLVVNLCEPLFGKCNHEIDIS